MHQIADSLTHEPPALSCDCICRACTIPTPDPGYSERTLFVAACLLIAPLPEIDSTHHSPHCCANSSSSSSTYLLCVCFDLGAVIALLRFAHIAVARRFCARTVWPSHSDLSCGCLPLQQYQLITMLLVVQVSITTITARQPKVFRSSSQAHALLMCSPLLHVPWRTQYLLVRSARF